MHLLRDGFIPEDLTQLYNPAWRYLRKNDPKGSFD